MPEKHLLNKKMKDNQGLANFLMNEDMLKNLNLENQISYINLSNNQIEIQSNCYVTNVNSVTNE